MYYLYILECADKSLYTGITKKLEIKTKGLTRDKKLKLINSNENEINTILKKA